MPNVWETLINDLGLQNFVAQARQQAQADLEAARTAAQTLIANAGAGLNADIPKLEQSALDKLYTYIPAADQGFVRAFAGALITNAEVNINADVTKYVAVAAVHALARINSAIDYLETAIGTAPKTTPPPG